MPNLDLILFIVFGFITTAGLAISAFFFSRALRVAGEKDGDVKMFFWAAGAVLALIVAGMSAAYILLPIILFHR